MVSVEMTEGGMVTKQGRSAEWSVVTLGDVCDFRGGTVFKLQYQGNASGDYPFIKVSDMNHSANGVRIRASTNWVSQAIATEIKAKPESTEGGRRVSVLKRQEGAPVLLG